MIYSTRTHLIAPGAEIGWHADNTREEEGIAAKGVMIAVELGVEGAVYEVEVAGQPRLPHRSDDPLDFTPEDFVQRQTSSGDAMLFLCGPIDEGMDWSASMFRAHSVLPNGDEPRQSEVISYVDISRRDPWEHFIASGRLSPRRLLSRF